MNHADKCQRKPPCRTQAEMTAFHGTPAEFRHAVYSAIGEISVDEARIAISRYEAEWRSAPETKAKP